MAEPVYTAIADVPAEPVPPDEGDLNTIDAADELQDAHRPERDTRRGGR
jgi:hypothetical protein